MVDLDFCTVRKVDDLGRVVLPKAIRRMFTWETGAPIEVFAEDDFVVLQEYIPADIFSGETQGLIDFKGKLITKNTILDMAMAAGFVASEKTGSTIKVI